MPLPPAFVEHLRSEGYHPRSNKHSNVLGAVIVGDLLKSCEAVWVKAAAGQLVYDLNVKLRFGTSLWNIDLALGPPAGEIVRRAVRDYLKAG